MELGGEDAQVRRQHRGVGGKRLPLGAGGGWAVGPAGSALPRRRASLRVPAARPPLSTWFVPLLPNPSPASAPHPQGSTSQPQTPEPRPLAPAAQAPRQVESGGLGAQRPSPVRPSRPGPVSDGVRGRGGTSLRPPPGTEPLPAGSARRAGPEGVRVLPPWVTFPRPGTWARALSQSPAGGTRRPARGDPVPRPGDEAEAAARAPAGPGGGASRAGPSPFRWPSSRPLAGLAHHRGPMTTSPDPSRPGPGETTTGSSRRLHCCRLRRRCSLSSRITRRHLLTAASPSGRPARTAPSRSRHPPLHLAGEILCIRRRGTWGHRGRGDPGSREHGDRSPRLGADQLCQRGPTGLLR